VTLELNRLLLADAPATKVAVQPPLTRREFARRALQLAARLQRERIQCAALWFEDAALFATALFACWRAGTHAVLAADIQGHACTLLSQQADIWLCDVALSPLAEKPQWRLDRVQDEDICSLPAVELNPLAEITLCTSGSSGTPKLVRKSWQQLQLEVSALQRQWPLSPDHIDCVLGSVAVQHMYGLPFRVLWPLYAGVPFDRPQRPYPEALQQASLQHARCIWIASPALLRRLGERLDWDALRGRLKRLYCAGGVLPLAVSERFLVQLGLRPLEIYGSTETGVIAFRQGAQHWQPFESVALRLNDEGALHVCSPWVREGQGQTADAAQLHADGFELRGRLDRIVKLEGKRIALPMLEQALLQHPLVAQAHLGAVPRKAGSSTLRLAALLSLSKDGVQALRQQGRQVLAETLRQFLAAQFEPLAVPRIWRFFEQLPLNTQGKLPQQALHQAVHQRPTMPEVLEQQAPATNERLYRLKIPCDLWHFSGHFPQAPVLPGVTQIGWAMTLAQQDLLPALCPGFAFGGMEVVKFQQLIRPADEVSLHLRFDGEKHKLHFAFSSQGKACSSARILGKRKDADDC